MLLISEELERREVPESDGEWVEFERPRRSTLKAARKARSAEGREILKDLGPEFAAEMGRAAREGGEAAVRAVMSAAEWDVSNFDVDTLLEACLRRWSRPEPIKPETLERVPEGVAVWIAQEIVDSVRPESAAEGKDD